jgi:two-component system, sensor histidine kinase and response regulator
VSSRDVGRRSTDRQEIEPITGEGELQFRVADKRNRAAASVPPTAVQRPRILVIDDDEVNLQLLQVQLGASDYDVRLARGGSAGLVAALKEPPDLILLDVLMPGLDGYDIVGRLKSATSTRVVPVLLLTSLDARREKLRGLQAGADDFLTRPIDTSELLARVRSLLRTKLLYDQLKILNEELERRVHRRTAELTETAHELEAFAYSISHDLRAPLRSMNGFSQALMDDYGDRLDVTATKYLIRIQLASQRMGQMIDDLLKLSRVARTDIRCEPVDLSAIGRAVVSELERSEPDRAVHVTIESGVMAAGDSGLLRLAFQNLFENAWKFTRTRNPGTIEFGVSQRDDFPAYFVRDNGVGFDMAFADKLFGVFQRLHDSSEFEGNGVGLATVQRVVQRHGGRVWAESAQDGGSTFWFTLGRQDAEPNGG